jgi:hypothetical protein
MNKLKLNNKLHFTYEHNALNACSANDPGSHHGYIYNETNQYNNTNLVYCTLK